MKPFAFIVAILLATTGTLMSPQINAQSTSLRVLSSNGVRSVVEELQPDIERAIGRSLAIEFSTASSLTTRAEAGESFDAAILTPVLIEQLTEAGLVAAESYVEIARSGVGIGARPATGERDVSTPAALRVTLLGAESVAFTGGGQSRATIEAAFDELGIAEEMRAKTTLLGPGEAPVAVAAGEAELVLTLVSEILHVPGLELVGALPAELQRYISFAAGRSNGADDRQGADALLEYLAGREFAAALARHGLEPAGR